MTVRESERVQTWCLTVVADAGGNSECEALDDGGAIGAGLAGILVRTGKYREDFVAQSGVEPTAVADSIADVPGLLI